MNELLEPFDSPPPAKRAGGASPLWMLLGVVFATVVFGAYIGNLLFGANSLEVLYQLKSRENELMERVEQLQQKNATLQKEYFELKHLEPQ